MTKKHFIALAEKVQRIQELLERGVFCTERVTNRKISTGFAIETIKTELADFCQSQNSQFNRQRWLAYIAGKCGANGREVKK